MLVLTIKKDEWLQIGESKVKFKEVSSHNSNRIIIVVDAPENIKVLRENAKPRKD